MKKILFFISTLILFLNVSVVKADEITSFEFMDKGNSSFIIGANSYVNGNFSVVVEDTTQAKPYINLLIATTGYPDFVITENDYFANTVIKKLYSSGTTNINGYTADLYVVQFSTRGTNWNCSSSGLNCYVTTELRLNNTYAYNSMYQLQSIALTDSVLTDDYLANMQINQNNQIIEQGRETNEKLDNLDDTIQSGNQAIQDSITESNKETQEVIKDQFNSCRDSINLFNPTNTYSYNGTGITITKISTTEYLLNGTNTGNEFRLLGGYTSTNPNNYSLEPGTYVLKAWIDDISVTTEVSISNGSKLLTYQNKSFTIDSEYTGISSLKIVIPINTYDNATLKIMLVKSSSYSGEYEPYGEEICSNKIDDTNDKLDGIQGSLTDDSSPDLGALENSAGWLPAGPVDSILNLPLSLLNNLSTTLNKSCSPVILTLPYVNKTISLPCIKDLYDKMGVTGTIFNWAGIIAAAFILYNYLLRLYKWVDDTLTMRENNLPGYFDDNWGGGA